MLAVDLASRKISFDTKHTRILQLDNDGDFQYSIEKMVDVVGNQVRKKVRNLFGLHGKLWIARYSKVRHLIERWNHMGFSGKCS